jgi:hypothetical protein
VAIGGLEKPPVVDVDGGDKDDERRAVWWALLGCAVFALTAFVAHNSRHGAVAERIKNPGVSGAPRPAAPLFGWNHWVGFHETGMAVEAVVVVVLVVVIWRRFPERRPTLLMALACTTIIVQDPIMNWAPYAAYNPQLWHLPETWPWIYLSPTVEPYVIAGYSFLFLGPYFPAMSVLRRLQRGRSPESFVWKHPLICLALLIFGFGFLIDAMLETTLVWTQLYIYTQVIPFGSIFTGTFHQFPLIWESTLITAVMIPAGILLYRDDTGRTVAEKLSLRARIFPGRPLLGTAVTMIVIINLFYTFLYGLPFALIRASGVATSVACPWPFPESKVYDPQAYYEKAGQPGPFFPGMMDGWQTAQSGRPEVAAPPHGGRCSQ